jgi:TonB family protein
MRNKIQGKVGLECVVEIDGGVNLVRVVDSLDPTFGLDQEAIATVKQWRFEPGMKDGKPVRVLVRVELTFTLTDGPAKTPNLSATGPAAPLKWPDALISGSDSPSSADEQWQQTRLDDANTVASVHYPPGWLAIQGVPDAWLLLQNTTGPEMVIIERPFRASVRVGGPLAPDQLSAFADQIGRRMGISLIGYGQVESSKRLWIWFDFGEKSVAENPLPAPWAGLVKTTFDSVHTWGFLTTVDDQAFYVLCNVVRGRNASDSDMKDEGHRAGPVFGKILDQLTLQRR